ncbi:MAG: peptidase M54 [Deltaproteobacteria bacterium]|nr:MAG: peptidase M54 [Deltaproteobacteria bacterium]
MAKHPFLGLVALGPVDPAILRKLCATLDRLLLLPVRVLDPKPLPRQSYHITRRQYHAAQLLEFLIDDGETEAFRILGVTAKDLFIPILTFVFGEAQLNGKAAIISLFRPRGDDGGPPASKRVLLGRLVKLSLHELGHTFGLGHCREDGCLMEFSSSLEELDRKNPAFCRYCRIFLNDYFRNQGLLPPLKRYAEIHAPNASTPTAGSSHKRRP